MHASQSPDDVHQTIAEFVDSGRDCLLAVVLQTDGSTPCKPGAKAIMDAERVVTGTIGGGSVEVQTQRRAAEIIAAGRPVVLEFNLEGGALADVDPICGGAMRVLVDPTVTRHRVAFTAAAAMCRQRRRGALITKVRGLSPCDLAVECLAEDALPPSLGFPGTQAVQSTMQREQPRLFAKEPTADGQRLEVLVEPLIPRPVLLVLGGGHVGQAVAAGAGPVGFEVVVIDDRPEFTRPELFPPGTTLRCGDIEKEVACFPFAEDTYVVIVTRGHRHDDEALAACLGKSAAYIGMIGSRRKVAMMREGFVESGRATAEELDRVYAPIGLDLGSVTVPEIAASIVAQLIAVRRRGTAARIPTE